MSLIGALGFIDSTNLKFPVGLYTAKEALQGGPPFAVLYQERGQIKLRAGKINTRVQTEVIID